MTHRIASFALALILSLAWSGCGGKASPLPPSAGVEQVRPLPPRILLIGGEFWDGEAGGVPAAVTALERVLIGRSLAVAVRPEPQGGRGALAWNDTQLACALARESGAEIVLLYQATANHIGAESVYGTLYERVRGEVRVRVVDVATASIIASFDDFQLAGAPNRATASRLALTRGARQAGLVTLRVLREFGYIGDHDGGGIEVLLIDVDFATAQAVEQQARKLAGVAEVSRAVYIEGVASMKVRGTMAAAEVASHIDRSFPGALIREVTPDLIRVSVPPIQAAPTDSSAAASP